MPFSDDDLKLLTGRAAAIAVMPGHNRDPAVVAMLRDEIDAIKKKRGIQSGIKPKPEGA